MISHKSALHWYTYDQLSEHIHTVSERGEIATRWANFINTMKDSDVYNAVVKPRVTKLSELSAALRDRLTDWAIISSCEYSPATKELRVKLVFAVSNVAEAGYTYSDDHRLAEHLTLQLAPAFGIISEYLGAPEITDRGFKVLEMQCPTQPRDLSHMGYFLSQHEWENGEWTRRGQPFAAAVFLTYAPFDF